MRRIFLVLSLLSLAAASHAQPINCSATPKVMPLQQGVLAPIARELSALGAPILDARGVLGHAYEEMQSVDMVLLRMRIQTCTEMARVIPAPSVINPSDPAAYNPAAGQQPNAPWRFDMTQNGRRMTAEEFNEWMRARGIRVVPSRAVPAPPPAAEQPAAAAPKPE